MGGVGSEDGKSRAEDRANYRWLSMKQSCRKLSGRPTGKKVSDDEIFVCTCHQTYRELETQWRRGAQNSSESGGSTLPSLTEEARCGSNTSCSNRSCFVECAPGVCPFGDDCNNQRFQRGHWKSVKVQHTRTGKGYGIFAGEPIAEGDFIIEYIGEVLSDEMFQIRREVYAEWGQKRHYFMSLAGKEVIDANLKGNAARFTNHSCDPNAVIQKWTVLGECRIGFFALKDINVGEEITLNYNFERDGERMMRCFCGSANCVKIVGADASMDLEALNLPEEAEVKYPDPVEVDSINDMVLDELYVAVQDASGMKVSERKIAAATKRSSLRDAQDAVPEKRLSAVERRLFALRGKRYNPTEDSANELLELFSVVNNYGDKQCVRDLLILLRALMSQEIRRDIRKTLIDKRMINHILAVLANYGRGEKQIIPAIETRVALSCLISYSEFFDKRILESVRLQSGSLMERLMALARDHPDEEVKKRSATILESKGVRIENKYDRPFNSRPYQMATNANKPWGAFGYNERSAWPSTSGNQQEEAGNGYVRGVLAHEQNLASSDGLLKATATVPGQGKQGGESDAAVVTTPAVTETSQAVPEEASKQEEVHEEIEAAPTIPVIPANATFVVQGEVDEPEPERKHDRISTSDHRFYKEINVMVRNRIKKYGRSDHRLCKLIPREDDKRKELAQKLAKKIVDGELHNRKKGKGKGDKSAKVKISVLEEKVKTFCKSYFEKKRIQERSAR